MSQIVNTCVIYGNLKVYYNYLKSKPLKTLNPMGNFYRFSNLHKETQRFMENYLKSGEVPNKDQEIYSEMMLKMMITEKVVLILALMKEILPKKELILAMLQPL